MTFGEALRQLLKIGQIKQIHLANKLEYDVSYISRWVNNTKLPSLKNNDDLFKKIASTIVSLSQQRDKMNIIKHFHFKDTLSDELLIIEITQLLINSYQNEHIENRISIQNNAIIRRLNTQYQESIHIIQNTLTNATKQTKSLTIDFISCPSIHVFCIDDCQNFWEQLCQSISSSKSIRLKLLIDIYTKEHLFEVYRDICIYYTGLPQNISVSLFSLDQLIEKNRFIWLCKDVIYITNFFDPFSKEENTIFISNKERVTPYYDPLDSYLRTQTPIIREFYVSQLYTQNYFHSFLMQPYFYGFYAMMPALFMSEPQLSIIAKQYDIKPKAIELQLLFSKPTIKKILFLHKQILTDYIFNGTIYLFGQEITLSIPDRITHLKQIISSLENEAKHRIIIIEDNNPVFSKEKIRASIFLNSANLFILDHHNCSSKVYTSSHLAFLKQYELFFKEFEKKMKNYSVQDVDAIEYIRQGLSLIA